MMGQFIVKPNLTSVSEITLNNLSIKIYPNPAKEVLFLNIEQLASPKPVEVKAYNSMGKLIYQTVIKDANTAIDIGQWASGLYVIEIQQEGNRAFKKIIVE
ncbi:MAG: T9SS type A sorting domain-containing protein, partial [Bacteroidia bacterium]|nr:T9SS type A sorting domain-containing protein [Bacteroidia bacterium]